MDDIKYTFLLPAYKTKYLEEALLSIKRQSFPNFIVIVSDDYSPENIKDVFHRTVGNDARFLYRRNKENLGGKSLIAHWNLLVDICETEFFIMASDDDIYKEKFLEQIDYLTCKYPTVNLFRAGVSFVAENGDVMDSDSKFPEFMDQLEYFRASSSKNMRLCEANYCYRRSEFIKTGKYVDFPLAWGADDATHQEMSQSGCCFTKDVLFHFRWSDINLSNQTKMAKSCKEKVRALIMSYDWLHTYTASLREKYGNVPEIDMIENGRVGCIKSNIQVLYLPYCGFVDFIRLSRESKKRLSLSKFVSFYFWLRKHVQLLDRIILGIKDIVRNE